MKTTILLLFLLVLSSCNETNYKLSLKNPEKTEENILIINKLLKKITPAPHYEHTYPSYIAEKEGLYIAHSNINYAETDSISQGRYNPNVQKTDTISHFDGLTDEEVVQLKQSIYYLKSEGIEGNDYLYNDITTRNENNTILNACKFPFYAYPYKIREWRSENPDEIKYVVVLEPKEVKSDCFLESYEILDKKGNTYLIKNKRGL